jgi:hypothetical protein
MSGFLTPPTFAPPVNEPIPLGLNGQVLTMLGTVPRFAGAGAGGVTLGAFAEIILPAGTVNDLDPVPVGPPAWPATYGRIDLNTDAGPVTITGILAGKDGQVVWLRNSGTSNDAVFSANDSGSAAPNRIIFYFNVIMVPQQCGLLCYFGPSTGINSGQGGWVFTGF